jgi:hypothetical protein
MIRDKILPTCAFVLLALGATSKAQLPGGTVIDPLNNTLTSDYTFYHILDNGSAGADSLSFSEVSGSLSASFVGSTNVAEQGFYIAPATDFSTVFAVGDTLFVGANNPGPNGTPEDIGLAIVASNPQNENSGNSFNSRNLFDYAEVSLRSTQNAAVASAGINGTGGISLANVGISNTANADGLYIDWLSNTAGTSSNQDVFQLGYIEGTTEFPIATGTFEAGSTVGTNIGLYGDVRTSGAVIGSLSNLSIAVPEPATWATMIFGGAILVLFSRRSRRFKSDRIRFSATGSTTAAPHAPPSLRASIDPVLRNHWGDHAALGSEPSP